MELNKKFYKGNPLHIYQYEVEGKKLKLTFINLEDKFISSVKVIYQDEEYDLGINTVEQIIDKEISLSVNKGYIDQPKIKSCVIDNQVITFDESNLKYILLPKSISNMRDEKHLYIKKMVKYNGCEKKNVRCCVDQFEDYWHCTCGGLNFNCQSRCMKCGIEKEKLFSHRIDNGLEEAQSRKILNSNTVIMWLMFVLYAFHFFIIDLLFGGNIIFDNKVTVSFFGILNRSLLVIIPFGSTLALYFSRRRYNKTLELSFDIIRIASLLYINILVGFTFVHNSYLFVLFLGLDLIFIGFYLYQLLKKVSYKYHIFVLPILVASFILGQIQVLRFTKHDLIVYSDGITYICNENKKVIEVPEKINGKKVTKVNFALEYDYSLVEEIFIPEYVEKVNIVSMLDFPNLKNINLDEDNKSLEIRQGILFSNNEVLVVPTTVSSITIDWENVGDRSFADCVNLKKVIISNNVKSIGDYAFSNCSGIEEFVVENNSTLEHIGTYAFMDCKSITKIVLPNSIQTIDCPIFYGCISLEEVSVPFIGNYRYTSPSYLNKNAFAYLIGPNSDYNKADSRINKLNKIIVTDQNFLENAAFYNNIAKEIVIEKITGELGYNTFYGCKQLEKFNIPEGINNIGEQAFYNCNSLKEVTLPSSLVSISKNAFKNCHSLEKIYIPKGLNIEELMKNIEKEGNEKIISLLISE